MYHFNAPESKYLNNAGTIKGNGADLGEESFIAGVVAFVVADTTLHNFVNIGRVEGGDYHFVGGLVGRFSSSRSLSVSSNAGVVTGGRQYVGGLIGFFAGDTLYSSINTG